MTDVAPDLNTVPPESVTTPLPLSPSSWLLPHRLVLLALGGCLVVIAAIAGRWDWLPRYAERLVWGVSETLLLLVVTTVLGFCLAVPIGLAQVVGSMPVAALARVFCTVVRGTPLLLQLWLLYYGLGSLFPSIPGIRDTWLWPYLRQAWPYAVLSLTMSFAGYEGEVMRGAFASVPRGEIEAARAFGMSPFTLLRRVWLPLAIIKALPTLAGETVLQLKSTPLVATITVVDAYAVIGRVRQDTYITYEPLLFLALIYCALTGVLVLGFRALRKASSIGACVTMHPLDSARNDMPALVALRHDLHQHPELGLKEVRTSDLVATELSTFGYRVHRGLATTGLVATLSNGTGRRAIGIRADMDALPITEETGLAYASRTPGLMHACGHDGHTAMLLGAAKLLAERRHFDGTVHLIFQPAEENAGGARIMVEQGLFERFPCDAVYALHNDPARPFGQFAFRDGAIMAAVDEALISVQGLGGHGAEPQDTLDPIVAGSSIVMALQTVLSRNIHPLDQAVVTVGAFHGGSASNVIPEKAELLLGIRSFDPQTRDLLERRIGEIARGQAASYGMTATVDYTRSYDATINHAAETSKLRALATRFAGTANVVEMPRPSMGSEDFAYMLRAVPGSYFFLGSHKEGSRPLHHPGYDFNDDLLPIGAAFWVTLVEEELRAA